MRTIAATLFLIAGFGLTACTDESTGIAVGTLERDRIELVASSSEVITEIFVKEGELVSAGQSLLQLDSRSSGAELAALDALKAKAAARVAELERGPRQEKIAEAQAVVEGSRSVLLEAEHNLERVRSLRQRKLASAADLDKAQANFDSSAAKLEAEIENLKALQRGTTAEELAQARQALRQAEANVQRARILHDKLTIKSTRDGVVDDLLYKLGEQPPTNGVVAVVLASGRSYARVYIPQTYRAQVVPGKALQVQIDGFPEAITGVVKKISTDPAFTPYYALTERDRSRLAYAAEIDIDDQRVQRLPVGLPLQVSLEP